MSRVGTHFLTTSCFFACFVAFSRLLMGTQTWTFHWPSVPTTNLALPSSVQSANDLVSSRVAMVANAMFKASVSPLCKLIIVVDPIGEHDLACIVDKSPWSHVAATTGKPPNRLAIVKLRRDQPHATSQATRWESAPVLVPKFIRNSYFPSSS